MISAGVYRDGLAEAYFSQIGRHFANAAHIFRLRNRPDKVAALTRSQIDIDASISHTRDALRMGKGAILAAPHVCNYLMTLARLGQELPICVYLRWSPDARRQEMKREWCAAAGLEVILEPASAADPTSRAAACVEALRNGKALVMTPDIAQKADKGLPVELLNRRVYLPSGPASIAMLAEAPIVPVFGKLEADKHVITAHPAIMVETSSRKRGGRKPALGAAMQRWSAGFEQFLKNHPAAWFLWGDSRWTKVFDGNTRYVSQIESASPSSPLDPLAVRQTA